jgi:hypothetical protein
MYTEPIITVDHCLTFALIKMIKMILITDPEVGVLKELNNDKLERSLSSLFYFAFAWGCGS